LGVKLGPSQGAEDNILTQVVVVLGGLKRLHNEELRKFYVSSYIIPSI